MNKDINVSMHKLILIAVIGAIILMFSDIPYLNLLANTQLLFFVVWLVSIVTLGLNSKTMLWSFFTLLFYCLILILFGQEKEAQVWGDWCFPILLVTLSKYFLENRKQITDNN